MILEVDPAIVAVDESKTSVVALRPVSTSIADAVPLAIVATPGSCPVQSMVIGYFSALCFVNCSGFIIKRKR